MELRILSYSNSKLLKNKGYNEPCTHWYLDKEWCESRRKNIDNRLGKYDHVYPHIYENDITVNRAINYRGQPHLCSAPKIAEVLLWLEEKHEIYIESIYRPNIKLFSWILKHNDIQKVSDEMYHSRSEAIEHCLPLALRLINTDNIKPIKTKE